METFSLKNETLLIKNPSKEIADETNNSDSMSIFSVGFSG
jgi:hypothetical protein